MLANPHGLQALKTKSLWIKRLLNSLNVIDSQMCVAHFIVLANGWCKNALKLITFPRSVIVRYFRICYAITDVARVAEAVPCVRWIARATEELIVLLVLNDEVRSVKMLYHSSNVLIVILVVPLSVPNIGKLFESTKLFGDFFLEIYASFFIFIRGSYIIFAALLINAI